MKLVFNMKCEIIAENRLTYAVLYKYPVNEGHMIPRYKGDVSDPRGGIRSFKRALVEYNEND